MADNPAITTGDYPDQEIMESALLLSVRLNHANQLSLAPFILLAGYSLSFCLTKTWECCKKPPVSSPPTAHN